MRYAAGLFILGVVGLLIGALILVANRGDDEGEKPLATATRSPAASAGPTATSAPPAGVCAENPDPATNDVNQVDAPLAGAPVTSPVTVSGRILAFEATFRITIFARDRTQIADQRGMSTNGAVRSPFSEDVAFSVSEETPACIWVYENSARDGLPIHVVQVPVTLEPSTNVCLKNPDPATNDINRVDAPLAGAAVSSPVTVSGKIAAFEAAFRITIFDASGAIIADQAAMSGEGQTLSPFSTNVAFSVKVDTPACIWVYERSARDGSTIHVVQVPVTLKP